MKVKKEENNFLFSVSRKKNCRNKVCECREKQLRATASNFPFKVMKSNNFT